MDILDEIRGLRADLSRFRSSSSPPPFDDGFLLPFGIPSQKGRVHMRCFWAYLYLFLFLGGEFIFCWLELVELFRLYLGASLCTLTFLALATLVLPCWVIHVRGSIFFFFFVISCFKLLIDLCL